MLLTESEKKYLLKVLSREQRRFFQSKEDREKSNQLHDKIKQTIRNEEVNKDHR
ncbi:hypothetical protein [Salibacterium salarium]|uniref:hypothetical protein n=1 Tax=Salibacterium salarium TaxID=284579 RepID=UPI0016399B71|nr:hypothetical protein [Salibacterium salarium]